MKAQVVSFHCVLKNKLGKVIGSTFNQDVITQVDDPNAPLKSLAVALQNLRKGEKRRICLRAEEAYGLYDPKKVVTRRLEEFPTETEMKLGETVILCSADGARESYRVTAVDRETITLDANHPLAGQDLVFEIETVAARDATPSEIMEASPPAHAPVDQETASRGPVAVSPLLH